MRICLASAADPFQMAARSRALFAQRQAFQWVHPPGLPAHCREVPPGEAFSAAKNDWMLFDLAETMADQALAVVKRLFHRNQTVASFKRYYPLRPLPGVAARWQDDEEFGRQRLDGINPFLLARAAELPPHFPVTDALLRGVLPAPHSLRSLRDEGRLFLLDYQALHGLAPVTGRFAVAPIALFWLDDRRRLMPLAIQLGQSPAEAPVIFTPADPLWTWRLARTFVQAADGTYHEVLAHLLRTHLVMESVWVAAARTLPMQHPLFQLLRPHFSGTLDINHKARTTLLAPGGPIDNTIAIGAEGALDLIDAAHRTWRFEATDPVLDLARRGLDGSGPLPDFHYRDDALALHAAIRRYTEDVLRVFYADDAAVQADAELQDWAVELASPGAAGLRGLPLEDGRFMRFEALHRLVTQVIHTCSVEHAAVNNGQYDQFGWIPNTPGAMYLPPPRERLSFNEAGFVYALPDGLAVAEQLALVHLLSMRTGHPLGCYDEDFFLAVQPVRDALDRFRAALDDIGHGIQQRNKALRVPYRYLEPWRVARSIAI